VQRAKVRLGGAFALLLLLLWIAARIELSKHEPAARAENPLPATGETNVPLAALGEGVKPASVEVARPISAALASTPAATEVGAGDGFPSLRGTEVDGALERDAAGRFVANAAAVRLFDYFLSAEGEASLEAIRAKVAAAADAQLPPREAARALALYDRYAEYRHDRAAWQVGATRGDFRGALAAARAARIAAFGETDATRMFGDDEASARAAIDGAEATTSTAGDGERARLAALAESELPPEVRAMHARRAEEAAQIAALVAGSRAGH
jgi:lipase chaperone LimK